MAELFGKFMKGNEATAVRKKKFTEGTSRFKLYQAAQATLNSGVSLKDAVKKPEDESFNDWLAVHVVDFYHRIQLFYGTVADVCTTESCPIMSGGPKYEYLWQDGKKFKKPVALSASDYVDCLMEWINDQVYDESLFPRDTDTDFPKNFKRTCQKMLTRMYRVFVHVYIHHFDRLTEINAEAHCNTLYKHFYYFVKEFQLLEEKEYEPLQELTKKICKD